MLFKGLEDSLNLRTRLNESQYQAATYEGTPLLIVAGAGSGKTRTLVHRVAYLINKGINPKNILLLTFTRKAATEMLSRASALVGSAAAKVSGGTFHGLANSLLRSYAHLLNYPSNFGIMDQDDAESIINRLRAENKEVKLHKNFPKKGMLLNLISQTVNKDIALNHLLVDYYPQFLEFLPIIEKLAVDYKAHKLENSLMDFDDLLLGLENILKNNEEARKRIAGRYLYVLVDEYQDTNPIQARITYLLAKDHFNITAVGDDAQSIYAFRGASFRNIMDFPKIFENTKILKLEENYRSKAPILTLANFLISQAKEKYDKRLVAVRGEGAQPEFIAVMDQAEQGIWVSNKIEELIKEGVGLDKIAVLFRASSHSFDVEMELVKRRIAFTKYGGRKFLESAHIKDFLAFLKVASNPFDSLSLMRIVSLLPGIGAKGAQNIANWVLGEEEKIKNISKAPVTSRQQKGLEDLQILMEKLLEGEREELKSKAENVFLYYRSLIKELYPDDWVDRLQDLNELLRIIGAEKKLSAFLADMTLDPPNQVKVGTDKTEHGLTLSTIHSAKGLEWKIVFILSAVEGRFPPIYAVRNPAEIEEERRLMYVAVTRAEDNLFVMLPVGEVNAYSGMVGRPSRFLSALPEAAGMKVMQDGEEINLSDLGGFGFGLNVNQGGRDNFFIPQNSKGSFSGGSFKSGGFNSGPTFQKPKNIQPLEKPVYFTEKTKTDVKDLAEGQRVNHPVYGSGKIKEFDGQKALIDFDHFGEKGLTVKYANLKIID